MSWQDDIYNDVMARRAAVAPVETVAAPIIRQSRKGINKTEQRFLNDYLNPLVSMGGIDEIGDHESIRLKLANGVTLKPDFPTWKDGKLTFYEVKGSRVWEDSLIKLKVAASNYRHIRFYLCKYTKGVWMMQPVIP